MDRHLTLLAAMGCIGAAVFMGRARGAGLGDAVGVISPVDGATASAHVVVTGPETAGRAPGWSGPTDNRGARAQGRSP